MRQRDRKHHLNEPNSYESLMKVFQKVFQQKNKPDIFLINQFVMNPVQITPAHQTHHKAPFYGALCYLGLAFWPVCH